MLRNVISYFYLQLLPITFYDFMKLISEMFYEINFRDVL